MTVSLASKLAQSSRLLPMVMKNSSSKHLRLQLSQICKNRAIARLGGWEVVVSTLEISKKAMRSNYNSDNLNKSQHIFPLSPSSSPKLRSDVIAEAWV